MSIPDVLSELNIKTNFDELPRDKKSCKLLITKLRSEMLGFAKSHEFEKAAVVRDQVVALEKYILSL